MPLRYFLGWALLVGCAFALGLAAGTAQERRRCEQRMEERKVLVAEELQDERDEAVRIGRECVAQLDFALDRWGETLRLLGWSPQPSSPRVVVN